jgi:hypothetical protein
MGTERRVPIRAECNGVPVYGYGYTYIYGVSPDFLKGAAVQRGNEAPVTKLRPKKSWEITSNPLGVSPPRFPRSELLDHQPQLCVHLLDGDPETLWCSRPQARPDVEPAWVRIDLAAEALIQEVRILPREDGKGLPRRLTVKVSRDAWHWDVAWQSPTDDEASVAEGKVEEKKGRDPWHWVTGKEGPAAERGPRDPIRLIFPPRRAKQIWLVAEELSEVYYGTFSFSLSGIEVIDHRELNVASLARGAGVTVSSTNYGFATERELHEMLWPTFYDLGVKWVRMGYWGDATNWHYVEQEKGKYAIDPRAEEVVDECRENGVNLVMGLGFTNWLYTPQGRRPSHIAKQLWETQEQWYGSWHGGRGTLPAPSEPGMLEGYRNYVRFLVRHFKGRVPYYEIWNEENVCWNDENELLCPRSFPNPGMYVEWFKAAAAIVREEDPKAKIALGGISPGIYCAIDIEFLEEIFKHGVAKQLDVVAFHASGILPTFDRSDYAQMKIYEKQIRQMKEMAASYGFKGEYHINEWSGGSAPYPGPPGYDALSSSELVKAKYTARLALLHASLGLVACWCEPWQDMQPWDVQLFRLTFASDPLNPLQPQISYYVLRTLCTVLDGASPEEVPVEFGDTAGRYAARGFRRSDGARLIAVWLNERATDAGAERETAIMIGGGSVSRAVAIDVLNGTEQTLKVKASGERAVLEGMRIRDWPLVILLA